MNTDEKYTMLLQELFKQYILDFSKELYEQALESTYKELLDPRTSFISSLYESMLRTLPPEGYKVKEQRETLLSLIEQRLNERVKGHTGKV